MEYSNSRGRILRTWMLDLLAGARKWPVIGSGFRTYMGGDEPPITGIMCGCGLVI